MLKRKNTKMQLCNTKDILPYYTNRQNYTSRQEKRQTRDFTKKKKPQLSTQRITLSRKEKTKSEKK